MNIALYQYGIGNIEGGGGAERFFADLFHEYNSSGLSKNNLYFILDNSSVSNLKKIGKLKSNRNILRFRIYSNRYKQFLETMQLIWSILRYRIKVIHVPQYNRTYLPILKNISFLPQSIRPKIVIQIVNCIIPYALNNPGHPDHKALSEIYLPLFKELKADGYFSWYEKFVEYATMNRLFKYVPRKIYAVQSIFADTKKFIPQFPKKNIIVFASRLEEQKHPEWFIEAVNILKTSHLSEIKGWQFMLFGDGSLKPKISELVQHYKLDDVLSMKIEGDLSKYFNHSRIFVSCQDYENFTSLSLMEAMAAGNAIIAREVGQTYFVLQNNVNGIFIKPDSIEGLVNSILKLITMESIQLDKMGQKSVEFMKNTHNVANFIKQIDSFWESL